MDTFVILQDWVEVIVKVQARFMIIHCIIPRKGTVRGTKNPHHERFVLEFVFFPAVVILLLSLEIFLFLLEIFFSPLEIFTRR